MCRNGHDLDGGRSRCAICGAPVKMQWMSDSSPVTNQASAPEFDSLPRTRKAREVATMNQAEYLKAKRRLSRRSFMQIERFDPVLLGLVWAAPFPLVIGGSFLIAVAFDNPLTPELLVGTIVAMVLFWAIMGWIFIEAARTDQKWIAVARPATAKYEESQSQIDGGPGSDDDYDDDCAYKTKRQRNHEWYGDHSDLDWRDREQAQSWGMDADTYKSNWLESD